MCFLITSHLAGEQVAQKEQRRGVLHKDLRADTGEMGADVRSKMEPLIVKQRRGLRQGGFSDPWESWEQRGSLRFCHNPRSRAEGREKADTRKVWQEVSLRAAHEEPGRMDRV